jgi:regulator of sirC expression with transglutaminase-like and TPR domain
VPGLSRPPRTTPVSVEPFATLASAPEPHLDELALAMAGELREVDADGALAKLDDLAAELGPAAGGGPEGEAEALRDLLGDRRGFAGDREEYDRPDNSMLDLVLERRQGLPILLSTVYIEVARRAEIPVAGVGLPGHFVVAHFGRTPPLLFDPFFGGTRLEASDPLPVPASGPHETVARMLNNLVRSYGRRADLSRAIRAAELRLELPVGGEARTMFEAELRSLRARLN